ncbi:MAG: elongation factor P [Candidatus Margulisiibacteriota bacterium]|jgi:elongation factor P
MLITATQIRTGMILNFEGELYRVSWMEHVTPGKGVACVQTKLKNIINGKNLENRFRSNDKVDKAELETHEMQFLYSEPSGYVFMNNADYEQHSLPKELVGDTAKFLVEGTNYFVSFYNQDPIGVDFPSSVELKVLSAPPEIKKATVTNVLRPVLCENNISVNAPAFIKEGDVIRVNTTDGSYIERV